MTTLLITGANRGIGLEHVRQALAAGETVIAASRAPADSSALTELAREVGPDHLRLEAVDVASGESVAALAARLKGVPVDILINNAGIFGTPEAPAYPEAAKFQSLDGMDYALWEKTHAVNVMGPFRVTAALRPNLLAGGRKLIVMMSSDLGSIASNTLGTSHAYRASKAALNMLTRGLALDLKGEGLSVVSMAPGWTKTDLGGDNAQWTAEDSVANQRKMIAGWGPEQSGQFIDLTGRVVPW